MNYFRICKQEIVGLLMLPVAVLFAQNQPNLTPEKDTATIHIRLLNGRTGQPIKGKQIFFDRTGRLLLHKEDKDIVTGPDGIAAAAVPAKGYLVDPVIVDLHLCTKAEHAEGRKDKVIRFSVAQILSSGVVAANTCSKVTGDAKPGELVLWMRPLSTLERLTN